MRRHSWRFPRGRSFTGGLRGFTGLTVSSRDAIALLRGTTPLLQVCFLVGLGAVVALFEAAGVVLLVPLLALVGVDVGGGGAADLAAAAYRGLRVLGIPLSLGWVLSLYVVLIAAQAGVAHLHAVQTVRVREQMALRLRGRFYQSISRMKWRAFTARHSSDYVHTLTTQLERVYIGITQLLQLFTQLLIAAVYVGFALRIAPMATLAAVVAGLVLILLTGRHTRRLYTGGEALNEATQRLHSTIAEHLANMKVAKAFGAEERHVAHFEAASHAVRGSWERTGAAFAAGRTVFAIGSAAILAGTVYLSVAVAGTSPAAVLVLLYIFARLVPRLGSLQQTLHQVTLATPSFRLHVAELHRAEAAAEQQETDATPLTLNAGIRFESVSFTYDGITPVLQGVSFEMRPRQMTALIGTSGAGKTTIADLLLGLVQPTGGMITVDGVALDARTTPRWRKSVAYVPQESVLFDDTVRNNLTWAVPEAGEGEIKAALEAAGADFVFGRVSGLDARVGERGSLLSGGERQRIALARALLRRPQLLVLDEPTSSLDPETEFRILETLRGLRTAMTIVIISHRPQVSRIANLVLLLERGRISAEHEHAADSSVAEAQSV